MTHISYTDHPPTIVAILACIFTLISALSLHSLVIPNMSNIDSPVQASASPNTTSSSSLCGICDLPVTWSMLGVACNMCGQWFHLECQNLDSESYDRLGRDDVVWNCIFCDSANYSLTPFDFHSIDPSTHQSASFYSDVEDPFHPVHSSTPSHQSIQQKHTNRPLRLLNINFLLVVKLQKFTSFNMPNRYRDWL
eukprot:TRINITY_DN4458_c0_g1_i2.p2 TRINITY_DN4458_c0_g1~~TRINITY_DN4458_c0_g1_i2.p2  ORF type:complete len:194 (+),score=23.19 TRINITY_DN4458_c0_g1_i2:482-1063(+)